MRRVLRILSVALITAGLVMLADAGLTLAWKEPVSSLYNSLRQGEAQDELDELREQFLASGELAAEVDELGVERTIRRLANRFEGQLEEGGGIGRITIESAAIDWVFVEGTDTGSLQTGPGRYPETALPGQGRTVAIAGHRTTYGAPFMDLDEPEPGDEVMLEMPYGTATYEVVRTRIVDPGDVHIVDDVGRERLVLTACHPKYSAAQRIALFGRLVELSLFTGGREAWPAP